MTSCEWFDTERQADRGPQTGNPRRPEVGRYGGRPKGSTGKARPLSSRERNTLRRSTRNQQEDTSTTTPTRSYAGAVSTRSVCDAGKWQINVSVKPGALQTTLWRSPSAYQQALECPLRS